MTRNGDSQRNETAVWKVRKGGREEDLSTSLSRSASLTSARKLLRSWSSSASDDPMEGGEGIKPRRRRRSRGGVGSFRLWFGGTTSETAASCVPAWLASRGEGRDGTGIRDGVGGRRRVQICSAPKVLVPHSRWPLCGLFRQWAGYVCGLWPKRCA